MDMHILETMHNLFKKHGYEIRAVGGCVRDYILGVPCADLDFATNATPEQMMAMEDKEWRVLPTGIDHGTVTFMSPLGSFEVTTLRRDVETDGRHATVEFTDDWKVDAERRDFTFNAMSYCYEWGLFDYFDGQTDIQNGKVKFVGDAAKRIQEDALRIIRYFRFKAKFGLNSHPHPPAILENIHLLKKVSVERVWSEIKKAALDPRSFGFFLEDMAFSCVYDQYQFYMGTPTQINYGQLSRIVPAIAIGLSLTPTKAADFAETFKLSTQETKEILFAAHWRGMLMTDETIEDLIMDQVDPVWILHLAANRNCVEKAKEVIKNTRVVHFPVSGADLLGMGMKPGQEIGLMLTRLRNIWRESRYKMIKVELLEHVHVV